MVSRSSTKAECRSLAAATADILWVQTLLMELSVPHYTPVVLCDNLSAANVAHNLFFVLEPNAWSLICSLFRKR